jgi:hypothetical protein
MYDPSNADSISAQRNAMCDHAWSQTVEGLRAVIGDVARMIYQYERRVIRLIEDIRTVKFEGDIVLSEADLAHVNGLTEAEMDAMRRASDLFTRLGAIAKIKQQVICTYAAICDAHSARAGAPGYTAPRPLTGPPVIDVPVVAAAEAAAAPVMNGYEWP